jgi:hypothetical protein
MPEQPTVTEADRELARQFNADGGCVAACDPSFCPHTAAMAAQIAAHVAKAVAAEREAGRKLAAELERVCYANGVIERHGQRVEGGCGVNGDHDRCDCYFGRARAALAEYRKQGGT